MTPRSPFQFSFIRRQSNGDEAKGTACEKTATEQPGAMGAIGRNEEKEASRTERGWGQKKPSVGGT
jgi:hypothetical protein